jgi:hypothetical protein
MTDVLDELRGFCHGKTETVYTRAVAEIERLNDDRAVLHRILACVNADVERLYAENDRLREATRWRSVAEELPSDGDNVIVRHMEKRGEDRHLAEAVCEAEFYRVDDNRFGFAGQYCDALKATHWQPLPDPPK